jgi:oxaloacetate decarboxylase alpha subunit
LLEEIATYFRDVRKKYVSFEGTLRGVDSRILIAQVPGGMLTNMEGQLKEQGASDKFDEVLKEIPRVREDLGFIPLVTPTSQIVGTQAVLNVLTGERYKSISKETQAILKGEYGKAPSAFNADLQAQVLDGAEAISCRPADLLAPEMDSLTTELKALAIDKDFSLAEDEIDDVLTYALFPQIGLKYFENRNNPDAFEPVPQAAELSTATATNNSGDKQSYTVSLNGKKYAAAVSTDGNVAVSINGINYTTTVTEGTGDITSSENAASSGETIAAPLAGNIFKINVTIGQQVNPGDILIILEAMKMETEIKAAVAGTISEINVSAGDSVAVGDTLLTL